jgi:hypothetical protein
LKTTSIVTNKLSLSTISIFLFTAPTFLSIEKQQKKLPIVIYYSLNKNSFGEVIKKNRAHLLDK